MAICVLASKIFPKPAILTGSFTRTILINLIACIVDYNFILIQIVIEKKNNNNNYTTLESKSLSTFSLSSISTPAATLVPL